MTAATVAAVPYMSEAWAALQATGEGLAALASGTAVVGAGVGVGLGGLAWFGAKGLDRAEQDMSELSPSDQALANDMIASGGAGWALTPAQYASTSASSAPAARAAAPQQVRDQAASVAQNYVKTGEKNEAIQNLITKHAVLGNYIDALKRSIDNPKSDYLSGEAKKALDLVPPDVQQQLAQAGQQFSPTTPAAPTAPVVAPPATPANPGQATPARPAPAEVPSPAVPAPAAPTVTPAPTPAAPAHPGEAAPAQPGTVAVPGTAAPVLSPAQRAPIVRGAATAAAGGAIAAMAPSASPAVPSPPPVAAAPPRPSLKSINFDFDSTALDADAKAAIAKAADDIKKSGATNVEVDGFTDVAGSDAYNQALGMRRAQAVEAELKKDLKAAGVNANVKINDVTYGKNNLADSTQKGQARVNRRAVIGYSSENAPQTTDASPSQPSQSSPTPAPAPAAAAPSSSKDGKPQPAPNSPAVGPAVVPTRAGIGATFTP